MDEQDQVIRACLNIARIEQIQSVKALRVRVLAKNPAFTKEDVDEALRTIRARFALSIIEDEDCGKY
jgi:hypothetical protein